LLNGRWRAEEGGRKEGGPREEDDDEADKFKRNERRCGDGD